MTALPAGGLPATQTVEGGGQVRLTASGLDKVSSIIPGLINSAGSAGFCLPKGSIIGDPYCFNSNPVCGGAAGCTVTAGLNPGGFVVTADTPNNTIDLHVDAKAHTSIPIDYSFGAGLTCTWDVTASHIVGDVQISVGTDPTTGKLSIHLVNITNFKIGDHSFNGCTVLSFGAEILVSFLDSFVGQFVAGLLTPVFDNLIQGLLPDPLGIANTVDLGAMLSSISPGDEAKIEMHVEPGGYADVKNNGLSLGIITGINADIDPTTRTPDLISEPALCVPPIPAPDFAAPPHSLPHPKDSAGNQLRPTFELLPAAVLDGSPDVANTDVSIGISKTTLDLFGHHGVTSGALCMGISTETVHQLTIGLIGALVPSLSNVGSPDGSDPILLELRPQQAVDFDIGENTMASPAITAHLHHVEIDVYAFVYQRYTRAFTMDLSANLGVNLNFTTDPMTGAAQIEPMIVGLDAANVTVSVINSEFVKESPSDLDQLLPSIFGLVANQIGNIAPINVPSVAGFTLNNLSIQHLVTNDDFIALSATLGASAKMKANPFMAEAVASMEAQIRHPQPRSEARPEFLTVDKPLPEQIRSALLHGANGRLPSATFEAPARDAQNRDLEWSYNINGGIWRTWRPSVNGRLVISEDMFALGGKYAIGLKSRVVGDYTTTSVVHQTDVILDSVGPRVMLDLATWTGDVASVPVYDAVSAKTVQYGFASPGAAAPEAWTDGAAATISRTELDRLAVNGNVDVFARDQAGNVTHVSWFVGAADTESSGGGCSAGGNGGSLLLIALVGGGLLLRRRKFRLPSRRAIASVVGPRKLGHIALWAGASVATSLAPACSCNHASDTVCETADDCDACPGGEAAVCMDNACSCVLTPGQTGAYSDIAAAPDGTAWVSGYSTTFGDLVVAQVNGPGRIPDEAWEFVDGVPPTAPQFDPGSFRGGVADPGPDTGMYTSVAVGPDGTPSVSYFDVDNASLMFAQKINGAWVKHVVDAGGSIGGDGATQKAGMYTSLTLRSDDGRPGIAYLAHVTDGDGTEHAEVRFVAAQTANPMSASDWTQWLVDTAPVPVPDAAHPEVYPLPGGLGLFVDSSRAPDNTPVLAYYDRANGDLKVAKLNAASGEFDAPITLDGNNGIDAGWSPSVAVAADGTINVTYVNSTTNDFKYITNAQNAKSELIDNGYRIVGQSPDGLPKPVFDFVGDDAGLVLAGGAPVSVYQDATYQDMLLASRDAQGIWTHTIVAGANPDGSTDPWPGAYGFFASASMAADGINLMMSSWVISLPTNETWVEVFKQPVVIQ